ncbi:MAG: response regulator transcription factor [Rhodospirillaceae bacterium]|nr:response regulator transcription factor [Rhodospirillaceae bacterium]
MTMRGLLLADDHPVVRRGLKAAIEESGRYRVIAEAGDGVEAIRLLARHAPPLAVIDLAMPEKDGFEVVRWAHERLPETQAVVMTLYKDIAYVDRAVQCGAAGYLVKDDAEAEILRCLDAVSRDEFYLSPNLARPAVHAPPAAETGFLARLTPMQQTILRRVANYETNRMIAQALGISPKTVENHRANIAMRLDLHGPHGVLRFAIRHRDEIGG